MRTATSFITTGPLGDVKSDLAAKALEFILKQVGYRTRIQESNGQQRQVAFTNKKSGW